MLDKLDTLEATLLETLHSQLPKLQRAVYMGLVNDETDILGLVINVFKTILYILSSCLDFNDWFEMERHHRLNIITTSQSSPNLYIGQLNVNKAKQGQCYVF